MLKQTLNFQRSFLEAQWSFSRFYQNQKHVFRYDRSYRGEVKAVILDWAGTVLDCGVYAPTVVFMDVFKKFGVPISTSEAREPMGAHKRVHIQKITQQDGVRERWRIKHGHYPTENDVELMFKEFVPMQLGVLRNYSQMITGAVETTHSFQKKGLLIGTTTGFTTAMVNVLLEEAKKAGFNPDCTIAADMVPQARPYPYMVWMNAIRLDVSPIEAVVKVDDTVDGVREGLSAGCWSVGLAKTGNYIGLNEAELAALPKEEYDRKLAKAYEILSASGAHYVIDDITQLPAVVHDINERLARSEKP